MSRTATARLPGENDLMVRDVMTPKRCGPGSGQAAGPMSCFCDRRTRCNRGGGLENAQVTAQTRILLATWGVAMAALLAPAPAAQAQDKTFAMKLWTATINDTQHEAEAVRGGGREEFRRPHQARDLSCEPARLDPRQIEGMQFGSIQGWMGRPIPGWRR